MFHAQDLIHISVLGNTFIVFRFACSPFSVAKTQAEC